MSIYYPVESDRYYYRNYVCPVCKKVFCIPYVEKWAFKRFEENNRNRGKRIFFDRYSCMREYDKLYPEHVRKIDAAEFAETAAVI